MNKRCYELPVGGEKVRLRLTMAGQRALREQWDEDILSFLLTAAGDPARLCALLTEALNWPESGNDLADGGALYDALVDEGWQGQTQFAALAFQIGVVSGVLTAKQAGQLTDAVEQTFAEAFTGLTGHD